MVETVEGHQSRKEEQRPGATQQHLADWHSLLRTGRSGFLVSVLILVIGILLKNASLVIVGSVALAYTALMCTMLVLENRRLGARILVRHSFAMIHQPNMVTFAVSGHPSNSVLLLAVEPRLPQYVVARHRRDDRDGTTVFFDVTRKGEYTVGEARLVLQDPLRVFRMEHTITAQAVLTVVPRPIPLTSLHIALTSPLDGQRVRYAPNVDTSQITGTHPYDGEPMNRIHWKATAHIGTLVVKDFTPSASQTIIVLVDYVLHRNTVFTPETLDNTLSTAAASILQYAIDHKLPFGVGTIGSGTAWSGSGHDRVHLYHCFAVIAKAEPEQGDGAKTVSDWLDCNSHIVPAQSQLILLAHQLSETDVIRLLKQHHHFSRMMVILFPAGSFLFPGEHRAPYYFKDTAELLRLRSLQRSLGENGIELAIIGLNDPLSMLAMK